MPVHLLSAINFYDKLKSSRVYGEIANTTVNSDAQEEDTEEMIRH